MTALGDDPKHLPPTDFVGLEVFGVGDPARKPAILHMAAFIRANPDAPVEAVAIDASRSRLGNVPWDRMAPPARAGLEIFKLMLTLLDAKRAATEAAAQPAPLPPSKPARIARKRGGSIMRPAH